MKKTLLFVGFLVGTLDVMGQVYSAPGMPLYIPSQTPTGPARTRPKVGTLPVKTALMPLPATFKRYWQQPDSAKKRLSTAFYQAIASHTKYPVTTLQAQIDGVFIVRLIVLPSGEISSAEIIERALNDTSVSKDELLNKAKADLDAEAVRVFQGVRFEPSTTTDTINVGRKFVIQ